MRDKVKEVLSRTGKEYTEDEVDRIMKLCSDFSSAAGSSFWEILESLVGSLESVNKKKKIRNFASSITNVDNTDWSFKGLQPDVEKKKGMKRLRK